MHGFYLVLYCRNVVNESCLLLYFSKHLQGNFYLYGVIKSNLLALYGVIKSDLHALKLIVLHLLTLLPDLRKPKPEINVFQVLI